MRLPCWLPLQFVHYLHVLLDDGAVAETPNGARLEKTAHERK